MCHVFCHARICLVSQLERNPVSGGTGAGGVARAGGGGLLAPAAQQAAQAHQALHQ